MSLRGQNARRMEFADMLAYKLTKDDALRFCRLEKQTNLEKLSTVQPYAMLMSNSAP